DPHWSFFDAKKISTPVVVPVSQLCSSGNAPATQAFGGGPRNNPSQRSHYSLLKPSDFALAGV
ncbi:hypothetical protein, partial [Tritonibacter sp. SIMBA_163]|uniref:hypothetical protein n=1 Tax=Tritonibacter sp. SIMBA_163 TaxID=3080868 RepID=UPI0039812EF9